MWRVLISFNCQVCRLLCVLRTWKIQTLCFQCSSTIFFSGNVDLMEQEVIGSEYRKVGPDGPSRNDQPPKSTVQRADEEFNTQVLQETKGRVREKSSQGYSGPQSTILGALHNLTSIFKTVKYRSNSEQSGTIWNVVAENQEPSHTRPQVAAFSLQTTQTRVQNPEETCYRRNL